MNHLSPRWIPQPLTAIVAVTLGAVVLVLAWAPVSRAADAVTFSSLGMAFTLLAALLLAARFPIHLRHNLKLMIMTVPMFLIAVLLPPHLAVLTAAVGWTLFGVITRKRFRTLPSDIATSVGRWTIITYLASLVAKLASPDPLVQAGSLVGTAVIMFAGDVITAAFEISPMSGEPPLHLIRVLAREMLLPESVQYLIGILGAVVALQQLWALVLLVLPVIVVYIAFKNAKETRASTRLLLEAMADAIDLRDPYTGGHSRRVAEITQEILRRLAMSGLEVELIVSAARVHDIGKIGTPDEILQKQGSFTLAERRIMESHSRVGAQLLQRYPDFSRGKDMVLHHHERWDGKGYPSGLKGLEIPLGARIIAVADSFDAMTSDRPYRRAFSVEHALQILREGSGTQWDPRVVEAFLATRTDRHAKVMESPAPGSRVDSLQSAT